MFLSSPQPTHTRAPQTPPVRQSSAVDFVAVDVETACGRVSSICQIGIVGFSGGEIAFEYEALIDPRDDFSGFNTRIHGITADHVAGKPCFGELHAIIDGHLAGRITVAHSYFDKGALGAACRVHDRAGIEATWLDSVRIAKRVWPELPSHRLNVVSQHLGIRLKHHDALSDARAAGLIVVKASEETGIPLQGWLTAPTRSPANASSSLARRVMAISRIASLRRAAGSWARSARPPPCSRSAPRSRSAMSVTTRSSARRARCRIRAPTSRY